MAGVDDLVVYMQTAVNTAVCIYTTPGALRAPRVVYIESVVFYSSLQTHHQIVHTSHFPIFSKPKRGGGVYLWGPKFMLYEHQIHFGRFFGQPFVENTFSKNARKTKI